MDACRRGVQGVVTARTAEWLLENQCTSLFKIRMKICTQTAAGGQIPAQTWVREMAGKWVNNKEFGHKGWVWERHAGDVIWKWGVVMGVSTRAHAVAEEY